MSLGKKPTVMILGGGSSGMLSKAALAAVVARLEELGQSCSVVSEDDFYRRETKNESLTLLFEVSNLKADRFVKDEKKSPWKMNKRQRRLDNQRRGKS